MSIEDKIKEIVCNELEIQEELIAGLNESVDLSEYGLDSITSIDVVVAIENEYEITVADTDLLIENLNSIKKLTNLANKYIDIK